MRSALERFEVAGIPTTIPFHRQVLMHDDFAAGRVTTRWVEDKLLPSLTGGATPVQSTIKNLAGAGP
jgi:biotin carboxylase